MKKNISVDISFRPNQKQLDIIESWLIEEYNKTNQGFYCNWNVILNAFESKEMSVLSLDKIPIGFAIWYFPSNYTARIDIIQIKSTFQKQGFGKFFIEQLFKFFLSHDILVVHLECAPDSSERYWRNIKFIDFPDNDRWQYGNKKLYRILVPHLKQIKSKKKTEQIELWDDEPYRTDNASPTWIWELKYIKNTTKLIQPIICPCLSDWKIRWEQNESVIIEDKVKRFVKGDICMGNFLIIKKMPKLENVKQ